MYKIRIKALFNVIASKWGDAVIVQIQERGVHRREDIGEIMWKNFVQICFLARVASEPFKADEKGGDHFGSVRVGK